MIRFSGNSKARQDIFKRTQTIGIIASVPEIDTASASIALANYYRSAKGYNTALAIAGEDRGFMDMLRDSECIDIDPAGYNDGMLCYYVLKSRNDLEKLMDKGFDRIVIDLGTDYGRYTGEDLLLIEKINALISTSQWRCLNTREFLFSTIVSENKLRQRFRNLAYSVTGTSKMNQAIGDEFRIAIKGIGEIMGISDPYRLTKADLQMISRLV